MLKHWTTGTVLLSIGAVPSFANAYTISNAFLPECHEKLASEALRAVRVDLETAGPLPLTRDERALDRRRHEGFGCRHAPDRHS
jgi:hypothetical protein